MRKGIANTIGFWSLISALILLSALTVALGVRNSQIRRENVALKNEAKYIHESMWLPKFEAPLVGGGIVRVGHSDKRTQVLVYFSPTCKFCIESMPFIREMSRFSARRTDVEVIGLSRIGGHEMSNFIHKQAIDFPVAVVDDPRLAHVLRFAVTPSFVVVRHDGRVEYVKLGQISNSQDAALVMMKAVNAANQGSFGTSKAM